MTCDMHMHMYMSCISQADGKRGVGANVTNGAPENAVLERYKRGRFAVRAHTARNQHTHNVIARARYALPKRCLADDRSLSLALWALSL